MKQIPLTQGKFAIVDDEDYPYLSRFEWYARTDSDNKIYPVAGFGTVEGGRKAGRKQVEMVSFLIRKNKNEDVSYKNSNSLDCRKENLFLIHTSQVVHRGIKRRTHNGKPCSSKYKGVSWNTKRERWIMQLRLKKENIIYSYYSVFKKEKDAAIYYNEKARELFGEYAYQNNIDGATHNDN